MNVSNMTYYAMGDRKFINTIALYLKAQGFITKITKHKCNLFAIYYNG